MFIRQKKNKGGSISVQLIDKSSGQFVIIQTIGSTKDKQELEYFLRLARHEMHSYKKQPELDFDLVAEKEFINTFLNQLDKISMVGPELILGKLFDEIGFNTLKERLLRYLVLARLVYPVSKLKTTDYLYKYAGEEIQVDSLYRYLDKLHKEQMEEVKRISFLHTEKILGAQVGILYYDVTTLYFEAEEEDDLRKLGYSKDGKPQQPQILLGLLVSEGGYPVDFEIHEGNTYEGDTLLGIVERFEQKYKIKNPIIVADAGLLSTKNIDALEAKKYPFILGARIKNEAKAIQDQILALALTDNQSKELERKGSQRLIIHYSKHRAGHDARTRERGIKRLEKRIQTNKLTKAQINNRGYNKFLKMKGEINVELDKERIKLDQQWDGLKGYITNCDLSTENVIKQYNELWQIEKAFRISKSDLRIRPVYHRIRRRIEAHICIAFMACKIYKELERQLKIGKSSLSPEKAIDIMKTIYELTIISPYSPRKHTRIWVKTQEQKDLLILFRVEF